ncbi:MAG: CocE/NonD family hydrolase [Microthrixaceae bacterium]
MNLRNLALVVAVPAVLLFGCSKSESSGPTDAALKNAPEGFVAIGSIDQASAVGIPPKAKVELFDAQGKVLRSATADKLGAVMFYDVAPASGYTVRGDFGQGEVSTKAVTVLSREEVPPASQYTDQTFTPGLNYIRMRDGIELAMTLRLPAGKTLADGPFPTVIEYSGYEVAPPNDLLTSIAATIGNPSAKSDPLAPSSSTAVGSLITPLLGFATVSVQIRGSGCSGGAFDLFALPTIYDGYDAVETVGVQPWVANNKVGMVGISYSGFSQLFVGGTRPPHLAALAPMSVTDDLYTGIGFPGGIQNTGFAKGWITERQNDAKAAPEGGQPWASVLIAQGDEQCKDNQVLHGQAKDGVKLISELEFREPELFQDRNPGDWAAKIDVPTFIVGGVQDEQLNSHWIEALSGMTDNPDLWITIYNGMHNDALSPQILTRWVEFLDLFVADRVPNVSGDLMGISGLLAEQGSGAKAEPLQQSKLASFESLEEARAAFRAEPMVTVLLDVGSGPLGPGSLQAGYVQTFDTWPPENIQAQTLFTAPDGSLTESASTSDSADLFDEYIADPAARPETSQDNSEGKPLANFKDEPNNWVPLVSGKGLGYSSSPLSQDVMIAGASSFDAYIEASKPDTDLQVTLSEVRPDGKEMYVQTGWLRATHRKIDPKRSTPTDPYQTHRAKDAEPLTAGTPQLARVQIFPVVYTFRAGSRIRVSVSAPGGDRPIWTFNSVDDGTTAVKLFRSAQYPSALVLAVVEGATAGAPLPPCGTLRGQQCRVFEPSSTGG